VDFPAAAPEQIAPVPGRNALLFIQDMLGGNMHHVGQLNTTGIAIFLQM